MLPCSCPKTSHSASLDSLGQLLVSNEQVDLFTVQAALRPRSLGQPLSSNEQLDLFTMQAAPRPRRFKETTNSKWDDYYEAESPPSFPHLQRISSARQGSYSDKALLLLSGMPHLASPIQHQPHSCLCYLCNTSFEPTAPRPGRNTGSKVGLGGNMLHVVYVPSCPCNCYSHRVHANVSVVCSSSSREHVSHSSLVEQSI